MMNDCGLHSTTLHDLLNWVEMENPHVSHNNTTHCNTHLVGQSHLISTESDIGFRICIHFASNGPFQDDIISGYALIGSLKSMFSDDVKTVIDKTQRQLSKRLAGPFIPFPGLV